MNSAHLVSSAFVLPVSEKQWGFSSLSRWTDGWVPDHPAALSDQYDKVNTHTSWGCKEAWKQAAVPLIQKKKKGQSRMYFPHLSGYQACVAAQSKRFGQNVKGVPMQIKSNTYGIKFHRNSFGIWFEFCATMCFSVETIVLESMTLSAACIVVHTIVSNVQLILIRELI